MSLTFVMIKPDATERNLVGEILARFERAGFRVAALDFRRLARPDAEYLYAEHSGRGHFNDLVDYTVSGPVALLALEGGEGAAGRGRELIGSSRFGEAAPGTIRADFAIDFRRNAVHGSDSPEAAQREIRHFFPQLVAKD